TFARGAPIKFTNGVDFWSTMRANSRGFADAEPATPKPKDTFRILLVGDSFVEALQVNLEQKMQTRLAAALRAKYPDRKFDVVAVGMAGTGQANQLTFYERNRDLSPDLVVLLFVSNDFANNSPLLEAVRHGWHPDHSPMLFLRPD